MVLSREVCLFIFKYIIEKNITSSVHQNRMMRIVLSYHTMQREFCMKFHPIKKLHTKANGHERIKPTPTLKTSVDC
jgi:hypothetical protein